MPEVELRRGGRPNRTSREQIIAAALFTLNAEGVEGMSMAKVARRIDVTVMTLYNYFPSKEALLDAVAGALFEPFELSNHDGPWDQALMAWLYELLLLFEQNPVGLKLVKWNKRITPSWMAVLVPLRGVLTKAGLSGERLAMVCMLVQQISWGLIIGRLQGPAPQEMSALIEETTKPLAKAMLESYLSHSSAAGDRRLFQLGVRSIVELVRQQVDEAKAATVE